MNNTIDEVLKYFPRKISNLIYDKLIDAEEIRLRQAKPIIIKKSGTSIVIEYNVSSEEIIECLQRICEYSVYSYQNQISQGFITVMGGHRIGLTGSCVFEDGKITNIKYVNSLNFRIARQVYGASKNVLPEIINGNTIFNTIIVSPPGYGKTTILKDVIRNLSSGINGFNAIDVGVVDERGEIAALFKGKCQNDLGIRVDVLENVTKSIGIKMLVRTMAPKVVVADEIGCKDDIDAINYTFCSGVKGIFTAHGDSYSDFIKNPIMKELLELRIIEKLIFLDKEKGNIKEIIELGDKEECCI
ncbi:MAG: stage III sporulation protein AA [Clostridia bacterium]|nr:stage III sporulation protein AA [Clostridia bacterium]